MEQSLQEKYYQLLTRYVTQPQEKHSAAAAELGRELALADVPPEELGALHEKAIQGLAPAFPNIEPLDVVRIISTPMMAVFMAYGLAFRQLHEKLGKGAEVALQESEDRYHAIFVEARDGIVLIDGKTGKIVDCNPEFEKQTGRTLTQLKRMNIWEIRPPDKREAARKLFFEIRQKRLKGSREHEFQKPDGKNVLVEFTSKPIVIQGRPYHQSIVRDITEHKQAEQALRDSEKRYRCLFEATFEAIIIHEQGKILDTNQSAETMFRYPRAEAVGMSVLDFTAAESREDVMQNIRAGKTPPYEANCLRRDGTTFYGEICAKSIDYLGRKVRVIAIRDITERKQADAALNQRVQELNSLNTLSRRVSANLPLHRVVQAALDGIATAITPDLVMIFLKEGDKLILQDAGPGNTKIKHKETPIHRIGECLCGLAVKEDKPIYSVNIHTDLRCTWMECKKAGVRSFAALPLRSGDKVLGLMGLASKVERDFSQQADFLETLANAIATGLQNALLYEQVRRHGKELEERVTERTEELKQANIRLQEADRLKSIFLASMSHELRTPLNSIIGFTGIILQGMAGKINAEQKKQLTMVKSGANHLLSLINDLLDVSKIESGEVELFLQKFDLHEIVREVVETFSPEIDKKGLKLLVEIREEITLVSDKRRVKQVLMNLVSNAIKFTERGSIKIKAGLSSTGKMQASVKDSGIGIKPANMNKLFMPFQQIDFSLTKKYEGTGLGLYLCKKLVSLLAGEIFATSRYSKGSEFTFTLPLKLNATKQKSVRQKMNKIEN